MARRLSPEPPPPPSPRHGRTAWLLLVPLALAAAAYARVLDGEFQFDDLRSISGNLAIKDLGAFLRGFGEALFHSGRPVTELTFALNYSAGRLDPWPFHLTNLLVHLGVTGLVFLFTRGVLRLARAARPAGVAVAVAGLFALHPLQSQAVSYVCQRAEALASGLYLAALLLLLQAERRGRSLVGVSLCVAATATFVLALGSKPIAVTAPFAYLLVLLVAPSEEARRTLAPWPRRLALVAPWLALDAWFSATTLHGLEGAPDAGFGVAGVTPWTYFVTQWRAVATYLRLLFWPSGQNVDWGLARSTGLDPASLGAGLLLAGLLATAAALWWRARRAAGEDAAARRVAALGVAWFLLVLAPTSSLVPIADVLVEHRAYLASWGILVAVGVLGERLVSRLPEARRLPVAAGTVGAAWLVLAAVLYARNAVWTTQVALWADSVAKTPGNPRSHVNLGNAYRERGQVEPALREYRTALDLMGGDPFFASLRAVALNQVGTALANAGRDAEAEPAFRRALADDPRNADALANLSVLAFKRQDLRGAEAAALRTLAVDPRHGMALQVLGSSRMMLGDTAGGLEAFERAVAADPDDAARRFNLGVAYAAVGRRAEACAAWREALRLRSAGEIAAQLRAQRTASGCGP